MLRKLKKALVESFVGAIAVGWMFANAIEDLASAFAAPLQNNLTRHQFDFTASTVHLAGVPSFFDIAAPNLVRFALNLLFALFFLRWLYFTPVDNEIPAG